ncbi:hypothetical protein [Natrialba sp. SSL1]|uniref:hypothetical protein n=1 Tax=Natrialba sp. SSL1 TaxID=1869245 RepID=UPI0008F95CD3|nr:hypothetical protein [Natrialba sp. SSL1]OIB57795.1 hypothetical protein BBD46_13560 [Natrialba sp. SSL1]
MLDTNHSSRYGTETAIADAAVADGIERRRTLEELVLDLLEGEFAGVIRSHVRGEVYGGC